MASMPSQLDPVSRVVIGGVDTHKDLHVAAVVDTEAVVLATESFSTTRAGYRAMVRWMRTFGDIRRIGVEGTGSYGAGITRHLTEAGIEVLEVDRPDRSDRRRRGKSDTLDAQAAALATLAGRRTSTPKRKDGLVESLRVLRLTRATAIRSRTKALQLLRMHVVSAPEELRDQVRNLTRMQLLRTCAGWRADTIGFRDPVIATRIALKSLARRILELNDEIANLDELINPLVAELAPQLLARPCIGVEIAGQILVTLGDNPARIRTEAAFAMLCGVAPLPASSGKTQRHRLNRGGDRQANRALHMAAISRMRTDKRTKAYVARKTAQGHSNLEIIRCIKRYLAREIYYLLRQPTISPSPLTHREACTAANLGSRGRGNTALLEQQ
jgi:transposase